jgi:hypothetical protein
LRWIKQGCVAQNGFLDLTQYAVADSVRRFTGVHSVGVTRRRRNAMTSDAIYCFDRASVLFAIYPEGSPEPRVVAAIAEDALRDVFGARGGGDSLVETCREHFDLIEQAALRHYRHDPGRPVMLGIDDFAFPSSFAADLVN